MLKAAQEDRAAFHNAPEQVDSAWHMLDDLLVRNGIAALDYQSDVSWNYSYPAVRDAVAAKALPVEVVY